MVMDSNFSGELEILKNYLRFASIREGFLKLNTINLSGLDWIYPITLLPLCCFIRENNLHSNVVQPNKLSVARYVRDMSCGVADCSHMPLCELPRNHDSCDPLLAQVFRIHRNGRDIGGHDAFGLVVSELVDNIYNHSCFNNAFVMVQSYPKKRFLELCFCDNGISIQEIMKSIGLQCRPTRKV